jgi:NAD(P)-dependent dehydrogenase (short-subunit alcohol dehydrogenase family)
MINYDGTAVLVTGAASGIGEALAAAFSARGARVICADVDIAGAEETALPLATLD